VRIFKSAILAFFAVGFVWLAAAPAKAQLAPGCFCPQGTFPISDGTCFTNNITTMTGPTSVAPICQNSGNNDGIIAQSVGHLASSQQQISFTGIQSNIQIRREQLQGFLPVPHNAAPLGYMPANLDDGSSALSYTNRSNQSNPLANFNALAQPAVTGPTWATWGQGFGDWEHQSAVNTFDLSHQTSTYGVQSGVDGTWQGLTPEGGALVAGVVGSWMSSNVTFSGSATSLRLTGPGIGLYQTFVQGNFSTDLTTKFDFLQLTEDFGGGTPSNLLGLTNAGVSGNIQYVVKLDKTYFMEPTAGFSFTRTIFDGGAAAIGLQDASTLRLQLGARWGASWEMNGVSVEASVKTLAYSDVIAQGTALASDFIGTGIVPTDQGLLRGLVAPELSICLPENYTVTLTGEARFGQDLTAGSVKLALRKQW
jgi:Autotransporter beta-domain